MVRPAQINEIDWIIQAQIQMAHESEGLTLVPAVVRQGVRAVFEDKHKGQYWVCEDNGVLAGMCLVTFEWSDWRAGTVYWIHSVWVEKEFRRQGVFSKIYCHLKDLVESRNDLRGLRLYVDQSNLNAQLAYQKMGMDGAHYKMYEWLK